MEKPINGKKKETFSVDTTHTHTAKDFPHRTRRGALISFLNFGANAIDEFFTRERKTKKDSGFSLYFFLILRDADLYLVFLSWL